MRSRCRDKGCKGYRYYGGKGVSISPEWATFEAFREWALANGYQEGLSIDRLDRHSDYGPSNCEWITLAENSRRVRLQEAAERRAFCASAQRGRA